MKALHRILSLGAALAGFIPLAGAQIEGPTPLAWRWVPSSVDYSPDGSPLVVDNSIYVAAAQRIYSLDATTGNEKWKFPLDGAKGTFRNQPILSGKTLVDVTDAGYFYAANIADGTSKWMYQLRNLAALGQPVSIGKLIVFKQGDETLNALDADTGQPAWTKPLPIDTGFDGPLIVHGDDIIFADNNNQMYSVNAASEKINWVRKFGFLPPDLVPQLQGDNIYLYSGQYLVAINAVRGTGRWQVNLDQNMEYGPAIGPDGMACVSEDGHLYFFDLNGRRALREVVDLGSGPAAQPAAVGDKYLVPTMNGALNLIDPKTGQILWSYAVHPIGGGTAQKKEAAPVDTGYGTVDNRLLTIPAAGPAVLAGNTMLVMCDDASILGFDNKLGVDLTPPDVDMLFPPPGAQTPGNPPLDLVFKVSDEATGVNVSTLKIDVDGTPLTATVGRDGIAIVHISFDGPNKPLADGRRVFHITVSDWMGNVAKKSYALSIDNQLPPLNKPAGLQQQPAKRGNKNKGGGGGGGG
jgi:outer membrane protein assembly factor BamB